MVEATYTLRNARPADAQRIHELHTASVRGLCMGHYSQEVIDGWLQNRSPQGYLPGIEKGQTFVAEDGGTILGFGRLRLAVLSRCSWSHGRLDAESGLRSRSTHYILRAVAIWAASSLRQR